MERACEGAKARMSGPPRTVRNATRLAKQLLDFSFHAVPRIGPVRHNHHAPAVVVHELSDLLQHASLSGMAAHVAPGTRLVIDPPPTAAAANLSRDRRLGRQGHVADLVPADWIIETEFELGVVGIGFGVRP